MSVRVVARIRPLLKTEIEKDVILETAGGGGAGDNQTIVKIPNPKCPSENYSFQFNSVYDQHATQTQIFDNEVAPHVKQLFKGYDVTLFAYGVTGTGKTHTMRGGKLLADRGVIPRLLSSIYRRARKIEKDSAGGTQVDVVMSYYEIYNDKVFDLFEPPEHRTPAGLPIRDNNGKTVVVGLTERPCTTLKEFEQQYDQANIHRSTSATKLNPHSSRSHAILCVKITQTTASTTLTSTASAIDLAGSEDNRRTDNNKDRLVESASINKSLFVLAQCVEALGKNAARIPYRESKMTRILSLGQNEGITVMILNLAPVRAFWLDTLSSLNFANRTKRVEVREVENLPFFRTGEQQGVKGKMEGAVGAGSLENSSMFRQPLRPKMPSQSSHLRDATANPTTAIAKPTRQFAVYADNNKVKPAASSKPPSLPHSHPRSSDTTHPRSPKRKSNDALASHARPPKAARLNEPSSRFPRGQAGTASQRAWSKDAIEALIDRKVSEALAERASAEQAEHDAIVSRSANGGGGGGDAISAEVQKRLDALEKRVEGQESERAEGLQFLLLAKQCLVRGEEGRALGWYERALPFFPGNEKLGRKVEKLRRRVEADSVPVPVPVPVLKDLAASKVAPAKRRRKEEEEDDESYHEEAHEDEQPPYEEDDNDFVYRPRTKIRRPQPQPHTKLTQLTQHLAPTPPITEHPSHSYPSTSPAEHPSPRTRHLLTIINTKDIAQIKLLKGVGVKRAEAIVNSLCDLDGEGEDGDGEAAGLVTSLAQLGRLKGVGGKMVENMRGGVLV